jgi:LuxR family maltose regulon positive regulatory protein
MSVTGLTPQLTHPVLVDLPRIALTKTASPAVRKFAVQRPDLIRFLDGAMGRRLILLRAPAGYGKTTLAAEWSQRLRESGALVAWLSLDVDDNEPGAFAYHLARAFESAARHLADDAIELLKASNLIPARNVMSALLNAASEVDAEVYLFLDDFHVLADGRCHELVKLLLRYAPSNLHLVLVSRIEPRFSLSRLRLENELVEIDAAFLKFKLEEMAAFLGEGLASSLGSAGVAKLHATTEGWPAALQLARILLMNSADPAAQVRTITGTSRTISEYFEDTLATEPEEVVDFLLRTSILDQMNPSLCSAVAGCREDSGILETLEREQFLLVPLDGAGTWYRYHHLLREFLTDRLRVRMGDQILDLHRRACRWYAARGMWTEAVDYAIAAGDYELAIEFIAHCAMPMVARGDLLTLLSWEEKLPSELMGSQLEVKLALAWGMCLVTRFKEAEVLLSQVEAGAHAQPGSGLWWRCRAARAVFCALTEDAAQGRDIALECLAGYKFDAFNFNALCNVARYAYLKAGDWQAYYALPNPDLSAGEASYVLPENFRLCLNGLAAVKQLKFDEAFAHYAAAAALAERYSGAKSMAASMLTGLTARLQYERGDVTGAEVKVLDALELIETTAFHEGFRNAFFVLVRAAALRGDMPRAMHLLNRAERLSWERGWGVVIAMLLVERTRLLLAGGQIGEAQALLPVFDELQAKTVTANTSSSASIRTWRMVARGLVDAAAGRPQAAAAALSEAFDGLLSTDDRFIALRVGVDLAVLHDRLGAPQRAYALLAKLMGWGAEANMPGFVLDYERRIVPILLKARDAGAFDADLAARSLVDRLLAQLRERLATCKPSAQARPPDELTARERSIIEFIARGRSNKEIARALGVTPETIKTHLKRIFQKLSAESRAQAVVRAQSLGMLKTNGHHAAL